MFKRIPTLCLTLFLLAGCTVSTEAAFLKEVPLNTSTQEISVPGEVITAMFELTNEITPDYFKASKKANQIFSPLSLWYALGVLREGASGASLTELNQMMKLSASFDATTVIPILSKTLNFMEASKIAKDGTKNGIRLTNGIFFDQKYRKNINDSFLEKAATVWGTETAQVDFTKKVETQKLIKDWVSQKTDAFIPDYEANFLDDGTAIMNIYNVLYLKDQWSRPFIKQSDQIFHSPKGDVTTPFMGRSGQTMSYQDTSDYQAAAFDGEKGIRVWFLLPKSGTPLDLLTNLKTLLTTDALSDRLSVLLDFKAPMLNIDGDNQSIKTVLLDKGYTKIFTDPEFANMMTDDKAIVNDIRQKTKLQMDENGFKAAAVTEIQMGTTSAPSDPPIEFTVDRPYLLLIEYQGLPLFVAQITDPSEK